MATGKTTARVPRCTHRYELRLLAGAVRDLAELVGRTMDFERSRTAMSEYAAVRDHVREITNRLSTI